MTRPALVASRVRKTFGDRVALDDVSFDVHRGEVIALLGPNGAGKTTAIRLLAGLLRPTAGTVTLDGTHTWQSASARARIGLLTETPALWDRLTVEDTLLCYAHLHGLADPRGRVRQALEAFDLVDRAGDTAAVLSTGMRQKVALARALLHGPIAVLLDEPTSGLDPAMTRSVRREIERMRRDGHAVLLSTHNLDEAARVADRVVVLNRSVIASDTPDALRQRVGATSVELTLAGDATPFAAVLDRAGAVGVVVRDRTLSCRVADLQQDVPRIVESLVAAGARVCAVVPREATLEDAYLAITGEPASTLANRS